MCFVRDDTLPWPLMIEKICSKQKHVRFQDEHLCEYTKIRKLEGKSPEDFSHYHVGGTALCADFAKRALVKAHAMTNDYDRVSRKCKYSNNYPTTRIAHTKCSSIYV